MDINASRKRRRPALACEECRRRKIKCDRKTPCDHCAKFSSLRCTYCPNSAPAPIAKSGHNVNGVHKDPVSLPQLTDPSTIPLTITQNSPAGIENLPSAVPSPESITHVSIAGNPMRLLPPIEGQSKQRLNARTASTAVPDSGTSIRALTSRAQNSEQRLSVKSNVNSAEHDKGASTVTDGSFSKTRFFGPSHWMNNIETFETLGTFKHLIELDKKSDTYSLLEDCKRMARTAKSKRSAHQSFPSDPKDYVPPKDTADKLVHLYLRTFESVYRILHIPTFQKEYEQYWHNPQTASTAFIMKLLLVMAIGTCFYQDPRDPGSLHSACSRWIYAAQSWMSSSNEKSRLNLNGLQIHCLLLIARQNNAIDGDLTWISAGSLIRMAMIMGLHRDPSNCPGLSLFQSELRRRLWFTVLEISVQSCLDSGMPPLISYQDFDCQPPSNVDDLRIDETVRTPPVPKPMGKFTQTSIQIALSKSLPLRLEVVKYINHFLSEASYDETLRLDAELTAACRSNSLLLQSFMLSPPSTDQDRPTTFQTKFLDLFTRRFLLSLHRPYAVKAATNHMYHFSRKVCLETSLLLLSYYSPSPHLFDTGTKEDDYTRLTILGGGMFKGLFLHANTIVCLELINQLQEDTSPFHNVSIQSQSRKQMRNALENSLDLATRRIEAGETNVKGHLFISCALDQIDALEMGATTEQGILDAALKSVKTCHGLLRARLGQNDLTQDADHEGENDGLGWDFSVSLIALLHSTGQENIRPGVRHNCKNVDG